MCISSHKYTYTYMYNAMYTYEYTHVCTYTCTFIGTLICHKQTSSGHARSKRERETSCVEWGCVGLLRGLELGQSIKELVLKISLGI